MFKTGDWLYKRNYICELVQNKNAIYPNITSYTGGIWIVKVLTSNAKQFEGPIGVMEEEYELLTVRNLASYLDVGNPFHTYRLKEAVKWLTLI